jgi:hypothetical protein
VQSQKKKSPAFIRKLANSIVSQFSKLEFWAKAVREVSPPLPLLTGSTKNSENQIVEISGRKEKRK